MVRQITPKEREFRKEIKKYHDASLWAEFDATCNNIREKPQEELEKRINFLGEILNKLTNIEWRYEELTEEPLPEDCSDVLERFDNSYKTIFLIYKGKLKGGIN